MVRRSVPHRSEAALGRATVRAKGVRDLHLPHERPGRRVLGIYRAPVGGVEPGRVGGRAATDEEAMDGAVTVPSRFVALTSLGAPLGAPRGGGQEGGAQRGATREAECARKACFRACCRDYCKACRRAESTKLKQRL